jgi:hypothetical protein
VIRELARHRCHFVQMAMQVTTPGSHEQVHLIYRVKCIVKASDVFYEGIFGRFDLQQLAEMKKGCEPHCFSTLGYNVAYCYSAGRVMKWLYKQALNRFQGVTGSFE